MYLLRSVGSDKLRNTLERKFDIRAVMGASQTELVLRERMNEVERLAKLPHVHAANHIFWANRNPGLQRTCAGLMRRGLLQDVTPTVGRQNRPSGYV